MSFKSLGCAHQQTVMINMDVFPHRLAALELAKNIHKERNGFRWWVRHFCSNTGV